MTDKEPTLNLRIADDKETVEIGFLPGSGAAGSLTMTLEQLSSFIQFLGSARKDMIHGKDIPALEGTRIESIFKTRWYAQPDPLADASVLAFQHPAFGPVAFSVPREEVALMIRILSKHQEGKPLQFGSAN